MSKIIKRPNRGESEEDLLKFQQEFLASKQSTSTTVLKKGDKRKSHEDESDQKDIVQMETLPSSMPSEPSIPTKKSRFRKTREEELEKRANNDPEENIAKHDRHMAQVLTQIIERDTRNAAVFLPRQAGQAFPSALHRGQTTQGTTGSGKKKSLFAQHMAVSGAQNFGVVLQQELQKAGELPIAPHSDKHSTVEDEACASRVIEGTGLSATLAQEEAKKIHEENVEKLSELSEAEILEERRRLLEMMDPKLVEFLTKKKTKKDADPSAPQTAAVGAGDTKSSEKKKAKAEKKQKLPVEPDDKWVNMDKVEYDKLEWMKDLPAPQPADSKNGVTARFDFHGNLLAADSDISVREGLHHHGEDPERAGYSLEELFQLARSSNIQQRVLALQVLSRVVAKAKFGAYIDLIQTPVLPTIVNAGVIFLFRWALDDSVDAVMSASVSAMHALLCNQADQDAMDEVFSWFQGHISPSQCPVAMEIDTKDGNETVEETDAEVASRDIVLALVTRMMFLQRLRHILESRRPQAVTVVQVLQMLTKVAQHSPKLSYEIVHTPGLLDVVVKHFLPTSWKPIDGENQISDVYGYPLTSALRLVTAICQAGRNMASHIIAKYKLQTILLRYIAVKPSELQLPKDEATNLQTQAFRAWCICLSYGIADQIYLDYYPTIMTFFQGQTELHLSGKRMAAMISCCETVVNVVGSTQTQAGFVKSCDGSAMETEMSEEVVSPCMNWSHVAGLAQPIKSCVCTMLERIQENYQFKKHDLHTATSCVNFLASYYRQLEKQSFFSPVDNLKEVEDLCDSHLLPFWKSAGFKSILASISAHSNLVSATDMKFTETVPSIVQLNSGLPEQNMYIPVVKSPSTVGFLTAVLRLIHTMCKLHKGIVDKIVQTVTEDEYMVSYMRKLSQCKQCYLADNHFTRFENHLHYYFLKLVSLRPSTSTNMCMFHRCALHLLVRLQDGDEHLAHDLLSTVIFSPDFIPDGKEADSASSSLAEMSLSETSMLKSATQEEITAGRSHLLKDVYSRFSRIRSTYLTAFSHSQGAVTVSRNRWMTQTRDTESLMTRSTGQTVLPQDWMFLPLVELYTLASDPGSRLQENVPPQLVAMATDVLHWVYVLECWRPNTLGTVSITLKLTRIMCTFMAGNDLFLEKCISSLLAALLREYSRPAILDKVDFSEEIPGLTAFYDLFSELLQQFESVSFGDSVFACYVLLAVQRRHDVKMRRLIWGEKAAILRIFSVPLSQVLIPIDKFLTPDESDLPLLQLYHQCLLSQTVRPQWSPVFYLTAVHHVNRFLYYQGDAVNEGLREDMWGKLVTSKIDSVRQHVMYYKCAEIEQQFGMTFYTDLPHNRQAIVDKVKAKWQR